LETLRKFKDAPLKVQAVYNLILDSAIKPLHAVELINGFEEEES